MIGRTISHYKILETLGEGGMGIVYRAQDTKLDRIVALKFLAPHIVGSEEDKARFVHEARAAAALSHPNICTVYEINEAKDQIFIAFEYIEGQSLKDRIQAGPFKPDEAIDIAAQIAEGLGEAHEKGIIHRDIKPANIMITPKSRAKIMDFGLAKSRRTSDLTKSGTTLGTVAYMSPEQARGADVDHRTDIWSLGVVLYEMTAGRRPFEGEYEQAVLYSILNEEPQPVKRPNIDIPAGLEQIIEKCLQKDPSLRYEAATDLVEDLQHFQTTGSTRIAASTRSRGAPPSTRSSAWWVWTATVVALVALAAVILPRYFAPEKEAPASERKMLAVLPFENLGPPEDEYFADGITEEITARLATIRGLGIIARTSVIQYKDTEKPIQQIGEELGVAYILEGTVRWQRISEGENKVRVTPQLIQVSDATHLWAEVYQKDMTDIFQVQSDIGARVVEALDVALLEPERRALESKPTESLEAYDYYLQGNDYVRRSYFKEDTEIAIEMFKKAIGMDSTFAQAWARLSYAHARIYWFQFDRTDERRAEVKRAADRAMELNPNIPETHVALGYYYYYGHLDYNNALEHFEIARSIRPNNTDVLAAIGFVQRRQGEFQQALANLKKVCELNPRSAMSADDVGETAVLLRRYEEAEQYFDRAISLRPDWSTPYSWKALLYLRWKGSTAEARAVLDRASDLMDPLGFTFVGILIDIFDRNYARVLEQLDSETSDVYENYFLVVPKNHVRARMYRLLGQEKIARAHYDSTRIYLEGRLREKPDDARLQSALGRTLAGLGRKGDAIREGKRAVELMPMSRDAWRGCYHEIDLAEIYTTVGEPDAAIDLLERLLSLPGPTTVGMLRLDPVWDPLRDHPRFQELLEKHTG